MQDSLGGEVQPGLNRHHVCKMAFVINEAIRSIHGALSFQSLHFDEMAMRSVFI